MEKLISLTKAEEQSLTADLLKKFRDLRSLAAKGLELNRKVTASVKIGKKSLHEDFVMFPVIVEMKMGNKPAVGYPIESIQIDGEEILTSEVETDSKGIFSIEGSLLKADVNIPVNVSWKDNKGNIKTTEACYSLERLTAPKADKLTITVPGQKGLEVNQLDHDGFITFHVSTTSKGVGLKSEFNIFSPEKWQLVSPVDQEVTRDAKMLFTSEKGDDLYRIKPSNPKFQEIYFTLPGTDQVEKLICREMRKTADMLDISAPGDEKGIITDPTAPGEGFVINLKTTLKKSEITDFVSAVSKYEFTYRVIDEQTDSQLPGNTDPLTAKSNYIITVPGMISIIIYPSKEWQKISFVTEKTVPQTIEFKKIK